MFSVSLTRQVGKGNILGEILEDESNRRAQLKRTRIKQISEASTTVPERCLAVDKR